MSRLGWIAATAGAIGVIGAAAWFGARGQRQLGATSRRGERSGAIEVPTEQIARIASKVVASFRPCGDDADAGPERMLTPDGARFEPITTSITTARGDQAEVTVTSEPVDARGQVSGQLETAIMSSGRIRRTVQLFPAKRACWPRNLWLPRMREVLAHEMAHAADPTVEQRVWRRREPQIPVHQSATCEYYNTPTEVTAHLAEVEYELRSKLGRIRSGHELYPRDPLDLLGTSPSWQAMARCLTAANRRRFLRMAAILYQRLDA